MAELWIWPNPDGITDLLERDIKSANSQLAGARTLWQDRKKRIADSRTLQEFTERLNRRFAIESNVIERVFTLDRGITEVLVEEGIKSSLIPYGASDKPPQYVIDTLHSALEAQDWLFDRFITNDQPLTVGSIKQLHSLLTRYQLTTDAVTATGERIQIPLLKGAFKRTDNQVRKDDGTVLRYCPPEHCDSEVERMVFMHVEHMNVGISPEVAAAWLHHRFTQIHPFQDGNGRVARCLAGLVFLKAGLFPLIVTRDEQGEYIDVLERADAEDLGPLVAFFAERQLQRFDMALNLADDLNSEKAESLGQAISSIGETLRLRQEAKKEQRQRRLLVNANELLEEAEAALRDTARKLIQQGLDAYAVKNDSQNDFHFQGQVFEFAKQHGYYADLGGFRGWARIQFETSPMTQLLIHVHARGRDLDVIVCAAIFEIIELSEENGQSYRDWIDMVSKPFEFYSTEMLDTVKKRFRIWLDETQTMAVAQVQKFL